MPIIKLRISKKNISFLMTITPQNAFLHNIVSKDYWQMKSHNRQRCLSIRQSFVVTLLLFFMFMALIRGIYKIDVRGM